MINIYQLLLLSLIYQMYKNIDAVFTYVKSPQQRVNIQSTSKSIEQIKNITTSQNNISQTQRYSDISKKQFNNKLELNKNKILLIFKVKSTSYSKIKSAFLKLKQRANKNNRLKINFTDWLRFQSNLKKTELLNATWFKFLLKQYTIVNNQRLGDDIQKKKKNNIRISLLLLRKTIKCILKKNFKAIQYHNEKIKHRISGLKILDTIVENKVYKNLKQSVKKIISFQNKKIYKINLFYKFLKNILRQKLSDSFINIYTNKKQKLQSTIKKVTSINPTPRKSSSQAQFKKSLSNSRLLQFKKEQQKSIQQQKANKRFDELIKQKQQLKKKETQIKNLILQCNNLESLYQNQLLRKNELKQRKLGQANQNKKQCQDYYQILNKLYESVTQNPEKKFKKAQIIRQYQIDLQNLKQRCEYYYQQNINLKNEISKIQEFLCPIENNNNSSNQVITQLQSQNQQLKRIITIHLKKNYSNNIIRQIKNSYKQIIKTINQGTKIQ